MTTKSARITMFVPALLALTVPVANAMAQPQGDKTLSSTPAGPVIHPQGVTGTDPQPMWPPVVTVHFTIA